MDLFGIIKEIGSYNSMQEENDKAIIEALKGSHFIVPSWGRKPKNVSGSKNPYQERALTVLKLTKTNKNFESQIFLIKFNKKRTLYPIHPERIGYKGEVIKKYPLNAYNIKGDFFIPNGV
jgi:hypothetical protein